MFARLRWLIAVLLGLALLATGCSLSSTGSPVSAPAQVTVTVSSSPAPTATNPTAHEPAATDPSATDSPGAPPTPATTALPRTPARPAPPPKPVHVRLLENDGQTFGVGMPIIAWFSAAPTDAHAFARATKLTVNGQPATGAWYFEQTAHDGAALEAHFRPQNYWPAHAHIFLDLPIKGLSAGPGLAYDDSLTLSMNTGAANIATVDANTLRMTVKSDGNLYGVFPVSLGAPNTPTARGTKVIMEQGKDISMRGPGYYDPHVQWTQRLTYGGEYLHSAPWNIRNIGSRSTSNGCTNLLPADAQRLFHFLNIGDVVQYPNANGPQMQLGDGYGDWNVPWAQWLGGGELKTT